MPKSGHYYLRTTGRPPPGNNYGGWSREAAETTGAAFVDHNEFIAEGLEKLGEEKAAEFFADKKLHAIRAGVAFNARMAVSGLRAMPGKPLDPYLCEAGSAVEPFAPQK